MKIKDNADEKQAKRTLTVKASQIQCKQFENKASTYEKDSLEIWTGRMFKACVVNPSLLGHGYHEGLTVYVNEKKVTVDGETDHFFEVDHKERRAPRRLSPERAKTALQTIGWLTDAEYTAVLKARSR